MFKIPRLSLTGKCCPIFPGVLVGVGAMHYPISTAHRRFGEQLLLIWMEIFLAQVPILRLKVVTILPFVI